jgi:hypothetical protein
LIRKTALRKEYIIPTLLVPIFGPLAALMVEWISFSGNQGEKLDEILLQPLEDDILWKTIKNHHEGGNIVPLEEALLINENETKRKMMLNALYDDPLKYLDVLVIASHNEDVETAHYATTTLSHSQRSFQVEIQRTRAAVDENPDNLKILDYYIALIEKYIDSGLLEEYLLRNQRIAYSEALDNRLSIRKNDKTTLIKKLRNSIQLKEFGDAYKISDKLKNHWPEDEDVWNEVLRVCIEGKDKEKLQVTIDEIQITPIQWTKQGKEKINLWIAGAR